MCPVVARAAGQKKAPLCVSWCYCHMAFPCSLNNTSQHVTFEKGSAFWGAHICSWEALGCLWYIPSLPGEPPLPSLPTSSSGVLAQVAELQVRSEEQGESRAQGQVKVGEKAPGGLCVPTPPAPAWSLAT